VILLVLIGLRAWLVETIPPGGGPNRDVRLVTFAAGIAMVVLVVAVALQGGLDLFSLLGKTL